MIEREDPGALTMRLLGAELGVEGMASITTSTVATTFWMRSAIGSWNHCKS